MTGWIKLHRVITKHWIWSNPDYVKAWLTILLTVNHEEVKVLIHGELIICGRGQSILSLQSWVKLFGRKWTIQKVRTFFDLLKLDEMINTEGLRKTTRLTVCNYETYQGEQHANNTQTTDKEHTDNTQVTTNKKIKNDNNEKNDNKLEIAKIWLLDSVNEFLFKYDQKMIDAFFDYWTEPTKSLTKCKYQLEKTWDTGKRLARWKNNEDRFNNKPHQNGNEPKPDKIQQAIKLQSEVEAMILEQKRQKELKNG